MSLFSWLAGLFQKPKPVEVVVDNPGNIVRDGTPWQGLAAAQTDARFCQFVTPVYGIRALVMILVAYQTVHGLRTIRGMIDRWAPPVENNTSAYVDFVAGRVGISADTEFDIKDFILCRAVMTAIIAQENGNYAYPVSIVESGLNAAGVFGAAK
jgi:hypothetical protein